MPHGTGRTWRTSRPATQNSSPAAAAWPRGDRRPGRLLRRALAPLAVAGLILAAGPAAAHASAAARPAAGLSFMQASPRPDTRLQFAYSVRNRPAGAVVILQQQSASSSRWRTIERLSPAAALGSAPGVPAGVYAYRVAIWRGLHIVAVSRARELTVAPASGTGTGCPLCQTAENLGPYLLGFLLALLS